jgi:hypothetical protein
MSSFVYEFMNSASSSMPLLSLPKDTDLPIMLAKGYKIHMILSHNDISAEKQQTWFLI